MRGLEQCACAERATPRSNFLWNQLNENTLPSFIFFCTLTL